MYSFFNSVEFGCLGRPFQKLNVRQLYLLQSQLCCVFGVIVLFKHLIVSKFQLFSC